MNTDKHKLFSLRLHRFTQIYLCGLVFLFVSIGVGQPVRAAGASLFLSPPSGVFAVGDAFSVRVQVDTAGIPINAVQATIYFPPEKLEVLDISKDESIFTLWIEEPTFSNLTGKVSFAGGLPHPGFGEIGTVITINFKAKEEGTCNLGLGEAKVLADDGKGTDILTFLKEAKYFFQEKIVPPAVGLEAQILCITHSQPDEWYNNSNPRFQWGLAPDITDVSFVLDQNPDTIPDIISEGRLDSKTYENIKDGIWYFHLRLKNEGGWSDSSYYKLQVDVHPPRLFEIIIDNNGDPTNPKPNLYFETSDDTSGVSYYKLKIGKEDFLKLMVAQVNPFPVPYQPPGDYPVLVRAVDMAGNNVETKTVLGIEPIESPRVTLYPQHHVSGEEIFYVEGEALPEVNIMIFLKKNGETIKEWQTSSTGLGGWSFSTKELIKSGTYYLSVKAKDKRGALSNLSDSRQIEVSLSGLSFGSLMVSFKSLVLFLSLILSLGMIIVIIFVYRIRRTKKILRKETREVKESVEQAFNALRKEVEEKIEMFDARPGFSEKERKVCDELKEALKIAEDFVDKEIKDVEKELE